MKALHMIELRPDHVALVRFLRRSGLDHPLDSDLGHAMHVWLRAAFADLAPQPFRVFPARQHPLRVLGYAESGAEALRSRLSEGDNPLVTAVCPTKRIASKRMPSSWRRGRRVGFEALCCPVARRSTDGGVTEKDVYLCRIERKQGGKSLTREEVYREWLAARLEGAAVLEWARLDGFELRTLLRRTHGDRRVFRSLIRPRALLRGVLRIEDADRFHEVLARGVGRHRAFGYGMLLLRPAP